MGIFHDMEMKQFKKLAKYKIGKKVKLTDSFYEGETGILVEHIEKQRGLDTYHYYRIQLDNYLNISPVFRTTEFDII